jgi:hypothetical protein
MSELGRRSGPQPVREMAHLRPTSSSKQDPSRCSLAPDAGSPVAEGQLVLDLRCVLSHVGGAPWRRCFTWNVELLHARARTSLRAAARPRDSRISGLRRTSKRILRAAPRSRRREGRPLREQLAWLRTHQAPPHQTLATRQASQCLPFQQTELIQLAASAALRDAARIGPIPALSRSRFGEAEDLRSSPAMPRALASTPSLFPPVMATCGHRGFHMECPLHP